MESSFFYDAVRRSRSVVLLVGASCAMSMMSPSVMAKSPEVQGDWFGSHILNDAPSSLKLSLSQQGGGNLIFGAGRHCRLTLQWASKGLDKEQIYDVIESNGGRYCDSQVHNKLTIWQGEGLLFVELHADAPVPPWTLWRANAQAPWRTSAAVNGRWAGSVKREAGTQIDLGLTLDSVQPGQKAGQLRYGGLRRCAISLNYQGAIKDEHHFSVDLPESAGGYCERLASRIFVVWFDGDALRYRYVPGNDDCPDACRLTRESAKSDE